MTNREARRVADVRMLVVVTVDLGDPHLSEVLATAGNRPSSVAEAVSSEVLSNLESVPYVEAVIVSYF